ncbi:MAG: hypothetical protein AB1896_12990 [Thermodesulfobacteriota bacterium]
MAVSDTSENGGSEIQRNGEADSRSTRIVINEIQLILAEKRTSLALLRTGIAILALPISVLSFLIATSRYYELLDVMPLMIPLALINAALVVLGVFLVLRSIIRIRHEDRLIMNLKRQNERIAEFID